LPFGPILNQVKAAQVLLAIWPYPQCSPGTACDLALSSMQPRYCLPFGPILNQVNAARVLINYKCKLSSV